MKANENKFNPKENLKNHSEIARSLTVFCVSSLAYQKLRGRRKRDGLILGFEKLGNIEIYHSTFLH